MGDSLGDRKTASRILAVIAAWALLYPVVAFELVEATPKKTAVEHSKPVGSPDPWEEVDRAPASVDPRYPFLSEKPVRDSSLKKRLTEQRYYTTRPGDTLRKVAHLLYGHKSWWKRLKADNKQFLSYRPDDVVPPGRVVRIRVPKMGNEYVVREGDWLIRIAHWKYGDTDLWKELYQKNQATIRDPNLIRPGDRLRFHKDGTITVAGTSRVVVSGVKNMAKAEPARQPNPPSKRAEGAVSARSQAERRDEMSDVPLTADPWPERDAALSSLSKRKNSRGPSSKTEDLEPAASMGSDWPLWAGILLVIAALVWAVLLLARHREVIVYPRLGFKGYESAYGRGRASRGPYDDLSVSEDFLDESNVDKIDIRPRPNYHSLFRSWLQKKLRRLRK